MHIPIPLLVLHVVMPSSHVSRQYNKQLKFLEEATEPSINLRAFYIVITLK